MTLSTTTKRSDQIPSVRTPHQTVPAPHIPLPVSPTTRRDDVGVSQEQVKETIRDLHVQNHSPMAWHQMNNVILLSTCALAYLTWNSPAWMLTPLVWLVTGHFMHMKPLAFHDMAHGTWHPNSRKNEMMGLFVGTIIMVPLSVYRYAHSRHHAYMSTEKDPELWPFVDTSKPRWARLLAACLEISLGYFYTPFLFLRSVLVAEKIPEVNRRRLAGEYALIIASWSAALTAVTYLGMWEAFLVSFMGPLLVAGSYQTLNKYTEHMGLFGNCVLSGTRSVDDKRQLGKLFSKSIQYVDHHGAHHRYARIPHYNLPAATPYVYDEKTFEEAPIYPTYRAAFFDMLKTLPNPRVGSQWKESQ